MPQDQPTKRFLFGEFILKTWECPSSLQSGQFPPSVAVNDDALPRDHERLSKRQLAFFSECGQLRSWDGETKTNTARVRAEFARTTGYGLTRIVAMLPFRFWKPKREWSVGCTTGH